MVEFIVQYSEDGEREEAKDMPTYPRLNEVLFDGDLYYKVLAVVYPITFTDSEGKRMDGIASDGLVRIIAEQLDERAEPPVLARNHP